MDDAEIQLVIRYDEEAQKLKFYATVPRKNADGTVTPRPLSHLELDLATLRAKGADEAERIVGGSVLVFFEFHSSRKTGIRDYAALGKKFAENFLANAKQGAAKNDPDAQFELAMHHLEKSIKNGSLPDLLLAEKWLQTAATSGSAGARDYLKSHWERMKARAQRRITDDRGSSK